MACEALDQSVILILRFSNIFIADALSMRVGDFLSSKAQNEWILSEVQNYPDGEVREMIDIYKSHCMNQEDAKQESMKEGVIFLSCAAFGSMPLLGY